MPTYFDDVWQSVCYLRDEDGYVRNLISVPDGAQVIDNVTIEEFGQLLGGN